MSAVDGAPTDPEDAEMRYYEWLSERAPEELFRALHERDWYDPQYDSAHFEARSEAACEEACREQSFQASAAQSAPDGTPPRPRGQQLDQ